MKCVIKAGLLPPTAGADVVDEQLWLAHGYRNSLVEIECERRRLIREAEEPYGIRALEGKAKELGCLLKRLEEQGAQGKQTEEAKQARAEQKEVRAQLRRLRETPALAVRMVEINGKPKSPKPDKDEKRSRAAARNADKSPNDGIAAKARRSARADSGLFWGTYLCVEAAAMQSFSETYLYDGEADRDPKFIRWTGEGTVGVQIQHGKGKKPLDVFGDDSRVSIAWVDEVALTSPVRSERRKAARTVLRMAVAGTSRGASEYTYAEWPMVLHRPIPAGARISWVKVFKRKVGPRTRWSCDITLDLPEPKVAPGPAETVAIVFGWRAVEGDRVRVAQWLSTSGGAGVLDISRAGNAPKLSSLSTEPSPYRTEVDAGRGGVLSGIRKTHDLQEIRDRNFNAARAAVLRWLEGLLEVPEWARRRASRKKERLPSAKQALVTIGKWRAQRKLAAFVKVWRDNRVAGDEGAFGAAEAWRVQDLHLWSWEESQRKGAHRRRNDIYRVTAARLADGHARILADGTNYKDIREKQSAEVHKKVADKAKTVSQMVSPGILRDSVKNAAARRGKQYVQVKPGKSALRCPRCGATHKGQKHVEAHMFACSRCGLTRDIFTTRLLNMLLDDGHEQAVQGVIRRQDESIEKLRKGL